MFELRLLCPEHRVETLSDALEALDALSISVEDADAHTHAERALFDEPGMLPSNNAWQRSHVMALFDTKPRAQDALAWLQVQDFFEDCSFFGLECIPDLDWVRLTQSQFVPVSITPEFWIVPTWHTPPHQARVVIRLDPGLAFGTGTHPTTRMCLRWIASQGTTRALTRTLDYGCGSGILAISAAKFGATDIDAIDMDPAAVAATAFNAQANQVVLRCGLPQTINGVYQTVLANILATPLKELAPLLCACLASGGTLVLAGILACQANELKTAYALYCDLDVTDSEDGWILMTASC